MITQWQLRRPSCFFFGCIRCYTSPTRSLIRLVIFNGWPLVAWPRYSNIGGKCFFQGHNDALPSSGTEPKAENIAVSNLRSYSLGCTAASWDNRVKRFFSKTQKRVMPSVGIKLATSRFTIRLSNKLSYAAAIFQLFVPFSKIGQVEVSKLAEPNTLSMWIIWCQT